MWAALPFFFPIWLGYKTAQLVVEFLFSNLIKEKVGEKFYRYAVNLQIKLANFCKLIRLYPLLYATILGVSYGLSTFLVFTLTGALYKLVDRSSC